MDFPDRGNERGQGVIEYILVLVVTVGLILGGLYQLNTAFSSWAKNYFGEYLSCLLETGELPTIGGSPGDSGVCDQLFKPFSFADGRPGLPASQGSGGGGSSNGGAGAGQSEGRAGNRVSSSMGGGSGGGSFRGGAGRTGASGNRISGKFGNSDKENGAETGSLKVSNYGAMRSGRSRANNEVRYRIDQKFAFENEKEEKQKGPAIAKTASKSENESKKRIRINRKLAGKDSSVQADTSMSFGDFIRWLIIAAIVIALVLFIGGQMLKIGKSMD